MSKLKIVSKILGFDSKPKAPPPPPKVSDKSVVEEKERQRKALAGRKGFQSSILTDTSPVADDQGVVARKQLLGQ